MMKCIMVIGAVMLLSTPVAMARSVGACAADIKAKCAEIKPGGGRIEDCVKAHAAEFSSACKARLARVAEISKACTTDVKESCPGKERSCILNSIGSVKDQCKEALGKSVAGTK
ncbi:hypothetical protein [Bradyrhizobium sp.]|uniref:hypothetical protein n=1 Tax=Bradyrhizobium sp. TaxID=376 RepID=UPI0007C95755|nr:hypothetical protein [Bradyrhizobium sp.]